MNNLVFAPQKHATQLDSLSEFDNRGFATRRSLAVRRPQAAAEHQQAKQGESNKNNVFHHQPPQEIRIRITLVFGSKLSLPGKFHSLLLPFCKRYA
jgi:hypothetical protein